MTSHGYVSALRGLGNHLADDVPWPKYKRDLRGTSHVLSPIRDLVTPAPNDLDGDAVLNPVDNCPTLYDPGQPDFDGDGVGDGCDNCPYGSNASQTDDDGDHVGDACDCCPETFAGDAVSAVGCPPYFAGDFDGDGSLGLDDFATLLECMDGPDVTPIPPPAAAACLDIFDRDSDGDVDLEDGAAFFSDFVCP